ncbi:MAG TPA: hypothetical protein VFX98_15330 [Longimicrobiaceae bacterium]|nr:hypothetical protein [Longimicrobiaceae bacterium]
MFRIAVVAATALALLAACTSTPRGPVPAEGGGSTSQRTRADLITREEVLASRMSTAYDVVASLRPQWLRIRGTTTVSDRRVISVFWNQQHYGGHEQLRNIATDNIRSIRFYSALESVGPFGPGHHHGVIQVLTQ